MFNGCLSLKSLDISHFDTKNVNNLSGMFCSTFALRELNISNFNTSKVESMDYMFNQNLMLKSLDIRNFDTSKVLSYKNFFNDLPFDGKIYLKFDKVSNGILKQLPRNWEIIEA